jgi:uncharacterized membrane protein YeaQ/YmgE (transglycosylase-associated protein family)
LCRKRELAHFTFRQLGLESQKGEWLMFGTGNWLVIIVLGGLAGGLAKLLMPGRDPGGCIITILLGIAGALLAGFLGQALGLYEGGETAGFIAAVVGAFIILFIYRLVAGRRRR